MKNIIFLIFLLFIFNSCSDELITIVDEYNPPYDIKPIPGNGNSLSLSFWSGVLADDFVGFNLYISTTTTFTNALLGSDGGYPTVRVDTHTRSNFTLSYPTSANIQANTLYYVTVTAFGTNDLAENGRIETKINSIIPFYPRTESAGNGNFSVDTTANTVTLTGGGQIKSYGYQTNFNAITVFTNNNTSSVALPYIVGGLYIGLNGSTLSKLWITSSGNTSATHSQGNVCNTI
ncbi:hypothetical protein [Brachyspira sp.]|uniref:hypothetical protein n=1 Tax=Brachyspira sp. TaxID=1977261 RepID=UPI003D7EF6D9